MREKLEKAITTIAQGISDSKEWKTAAELGKALAMLVNAYNNLPPVDTRHSFDDF